MYSKKNKMSMGYITNEKQQSPLREQLDSLKTKYTIENSL